MKLLLTSGGISNPTIHASLLSLLGKPISECHALFIPTAIYGFSFGPTMALKVATGEVGHPFCGMGWKSLGILELTALASLKDETWMPTVKEADVLLVGGGDPLFLVHWMRQSGFADLLPTLGPEKVYVGLSAGSMMAGPEFGGANYGGLNLTDPDESGLGLVDFAMFPHLDYPGFAHNTMEHAVQWGSRRTGPAYALDDETAIQVVDGVVEVISEGNWKRFN